MTFIRADTLMMEETGAITSVMREVPVPLLFVALSATTETPAFVGVPLIAPVAGLSVSPAGRPMAE